MSALSSPLALAGEGEKAAGRFCPLDYNYAPAVFARAADFSADVLYVAGGLYGNVEALGAIERLAAAESGSPSIVFNGDFHWFDAAPDWFTAVERGVARHRAIRGNVETEISRPHDIGAGCGCAYPDSIGEDVVHRSNEILALLRAEVALPARRTLHELPAHLVAQVGPLRIGIVHGDATSLAGWDFAQDALDDAGNRLRLAETRRQSRIDVFASTHTCLAALRDFSFATGRLTVINNGAAGMPNFSGSGFGIVTRIATSASPHRPLYGLQRDGVHIDALAVDYDGQAFLDRFLAQWPPGSPAYASYYHRIVAGPDYALTQAAGT